MDRHAVRRAVIGAPVKAPAWLRYVLVLLWRWRSHAVPPGNGCCEYRAIRRALPVLLALNGGIALALAALAATSSTCCGASCARACSARSSRCASSSCSRWSEFCRRADYGVSVQFLGKSISRGSRRIDKSLEAGLNIGRNALDGMLKDLTAKADAMARSLSVQPPGQHAAMLNSLRLQAGVQEAALYTQRGKLLSFAGDERAGISPDAPGPAAMRKLRSQQTYAAVESIQDRGLFLRVIAPVNVISLAEETRAIQLTQAVPEDLGRDAETVQSGYREYQELLLSRRGLKRLYGITLTLALLLDCFPPAASFLLSDRLSAPLNVSSKPRAQWPGGLQPARRRSGSDELGMLTRSFTADRAARGGAAEGSARKPRSRMRSPSREHPRQPLRRRARLRRSFKLRSANRSAHHILRLECSPLIDRELGAWDAPMRRSRRSPKPAGGICAKPAGGVGAAIDAPPRRHAVGSSRLAARAGAEAALVGSTM